MCTFGALSLGCCLEYIFLEWNLVYTNKQIRLNCVLFPHRTHADISLTCRDVEVNKLMCGFHSHLEVVVPTCTEIYKPATKVKLFTP